MAPNLPMGRAGTAEEVAKAILFLLSEESSYTTGSFVTVRGGRGLTP
jgi:NAD(P)-dependent dehydrogenase (short-subunit alcohol dehydrogenase family)